MFVEFKTPKGGRASVYIEKIVAFFEIDEDNCQILMNAPVAQGGTNESGTTAVSMGLFTVNCAESYDNLKKVIQQSVVNTIRAAMANQPQGPSIVRPN